MNIPVLLSDPRPVLVLNLFLLISLTVALITFVAQVIVVCCRDEEAVTRITGWFAPIQKWSLICAGGSVVLLVIVPPLFRLLLMILRPLIEVDPA